MKQEDKEHLTFIYNRMIEIHGENPYVPHMLRFNTIIGNKPTIIHTKNISTLKIP